MLFSRRWYRLVLGVCNGVEFHFRGLSVAVALLQRVFYDICPEGAIPCGQNTRRVSMGGVGIRR